MSDVDRPVAHMRTLPECEVCDELINASGVWIRNMIPPAILLIIGGAIGQWLPSPYGLIPIGFALLYLLKNVFAAKQTVTRRMALYRRIGLSDGHPWHDVDSGKTTDVWLLGDDEQWLPVAAGIRVNISRDPLLGRWLLREHSEKGRWLTAWPEDISKAEIDQLTKIINMAQALRDAQDGRTDSFDQAHLREDGTYTEQAWPDTTPGALGVTPGILMRRLSGQEEPPRRLG